MKLGQRFNKNTHTTFTGEFREQVAKQLNTTDVCVRQLSQELGISMTTLYTWKREYKIYLRNLEIDTQVKAQIKAQAEPEPAPVVLVQPEPEQIEFTFTGETEDTSEALAEVADELEKALGFRPTTFQTIRYLVQKRNPIHV